MTRHERLVALHERLMALRGLENGLAMLVAGLEVLTDTTELEQHPELMTKWPRPDLHSHAWNLRELAVTLRKQFEYVQKFVSENDQPKLRRAKTQTGLQVVVQ